MSFHTLLTHESPDLDAILSVLLIRTFGEEKYPGVSTAKITFASANALPGGKDPDALEKEGILCVDIGGGRFDTHPTLTTDNAAKRDRSASDLVAEDLGVIFDEDWAALVEYARLQDTTGHSLFSKDFLHHLVSIHTILLGLEILHKGDSLKKLETGMRLLAHIPEFMRRRDKQFNIQELLVPMIDRYNFENPLGAEIPESAFKNFQKWYHKLTTVPKDAFATHELDEMVSVRAIAIGAFYAYEKDRERVYEDVSMMLAAIFARESQWALAIQEFDQLAHSKRIHKGFVTHVASPNGMVIKAARYRNKGDVVIYRDPQSGATSVLKKHKGPLAHFSFYELAAKVRIAEATERGEDIQYDELEKVGTFHGWFLHQSGNLLIKGSPKATDFDPSQIALEDIAQMAYYQLNSDLAIPAKYALAYLGYQKHQLKAKFGK